MTEDSTWDPYSEQFETAEASADPLFRGQRTQGATASQTRRCNVDPTVLAKRLGISTHCASLTLKATTQLAVRNLSAPMTQRVRT